MASKASSATSEPVDTTGLISFDAAKLDKLKADKPWMRDPKHFKKVVINAAAAMKMVSSLA